jgi:hypothetical protein
MIGYTCKYHIWLAIRRYIDGFIRPAEQKPVLGNFGEDPPAFKLTKTNMEA